MFIKNANLGICYVADFLSEGDKGFHGSLNSYESEIFVSPGPEIRNYYMRTKYVQSHFICLPCNVCMLPATRTPPTWF